MATYIKKCIYCKNKYLAVKRHGIWKRQRYCSGRCRLNHWVKLNPNLHKKYQIKFKKKNRKPCWVCKTKLPFPSPGRKYCSKCLVLVRKEHNRNIRQKYKIIFHKYKTSKGCNKCGYNKYGGALDFHHINPAKKERRIMAIDWKNRFKRPLIINELKKCVLLCANCHREETFIGDLK